MAQRYELQIGEQNPAGGFIQAPTVNASQIGSSVASIGGALDQWAAFKQKQQDEWDAATVMNAQTEFQKQINDWLYNPETGQTITRKLGNSKDLTQDTNDYADKLIKDITGKLENNNQRIAFQNSVGKLKLPYWEQASRFEARETQQHKDNAYKSGVQTIFETSFSNPDSDAARAIAAEQFESLTRAHLDGADEATIQNTILELQSNLDSALILRIARDDPVKAFEILNNPESGMVLKNETREKLLTNIKPKAEVYEIQGLADGIVNQFGFGNPQVALDYIRENYSGAKEKDLTREYKTRLQEYYYIKNREDVARNKTQADFYDGLITNYLQTGEWPSKQEISRLVDEGKLSPQAGKKIYDSQKAAVTRTKIKAQLSKEEGWGSLSREEQQSRIMNEMAKWSGRTQEDREQTLTYLEARTVTGQISKSEVEYALNNGLITELEAEEFITYGKRLGAAKKNLVTNEASKLRESIKEIEQTNPEVWADEGIEEYQTKAASIFKRETDFLDPDDVNFEKKLIAAHRKALLTAIENSPLSLKESQWQGWFTWKNVNTKLGNSFDTWAEKLQNRENETESKKILEIRRDNNVKLNGGSSDDNSEFLDWVPHKDAKITSRFTDSRSHGKHNGIDIATPEGTPIVARDLGFELKVAHVDTENATKGLGNYVKLTGGYFDDSKNYHSVEISLGHLKKGSIKVKIGDVLKAGTVIAGVGNTGYTGNKKQGFSNWYEGKKHGVHLDLKIKVDGKYIDPEKFLKQIKNNRQAKAKETDETSLKEVTDKRLSQVTRT
ncbi:MAG: M23 family metallopeptidase [Synergistaceae bacterium]|nr:M23 family metallopeptidase [Synergistaceae bacterium]